MLQPTSRPRRRGDGGGISRVGCFFVVVGIVICAILTAYPNSPFHPASRASSATSSAHASTGPASHRAVVRINQLDCRQYESVAECTTWSSSTCSTAAMAEVMNYYGRNVRIHDVLVVQARIGAITPALGLVANTGIAATTAPFGFQTSWGYHLSLDQLIQKAKSGTPVIVGWPPSRYPGGHLVVVTGGTSSLVSIADSSRFNRHTLTHARFLTWWAGFSAIVVPAKGANRR